MMAIPLRKPEPAASPRFTGPASHSTLSVFGDCKLQCFLAKVLRVPTPDGEPQKIGQLAHEVIAEYLHHLVKTGQQSDMLKMDVILEQASRRVPERMNAIFLQDTIRLFIEGFLLEAADGEEVLLEQSMAVDRQFNSVEFDSPNAFFRGRADLVFLNRAARTARILDFKTGYSMAHNSKQVARYGVLAHRILEVDRVDVGFYFVRHCRASEIVTLELEDFRAAARDIVASIKELTDEREFKPSVGPWCSNCAYAGTGHCHADVSGVEPITGPKDAERVMGELERCDGAAKRLKTLLAEWSSLNGPVQMGQVAYMHRAKVSKMVDTSALAKLTTAGTVSNEDAFVMLKRSAKARKLLDQYSETLDAVGAIKTKTTTSFDRVRMDSKNGDEDE